MILGLTHSGGYIHSSVVYAMRDCGYRLLDTARRYGTESFVPFAIAEAGLKRDEVKIFVLPILTTFMIWDIVTKMLYDEAHPTRL